MSWALTDLNSAPPVVVDMLLHHLISSSSVPGYRRWEWMTSQDHLCQAEQTLSDPKRKELRSICKRFQEKFWVKIQWELVNGPQYLRNALGCYRASLVAQRLKRLPAMRETLEKEMATHSSILAWRIPWTEEPWGQEKKGTTEDEMAGWHHWLDGCESEWTPGVGEGQGGLACCNSSGHKESDTTERLMWSDFSHNGSMAEWLILPDLDRERGTNSTS